MTVPRSLARAVYFHLAAGIAFSAALFVFLFLNNYKASLTEAAGNLEKIRANARNMSVHAGEIRETKRRIAAVLPDGYDSISNHEIMLLALERLKSGIAGAEVEVEGFQDDGTWLKLPVSIEFYFENYYDGVSSIAYLQSFRMPYLEISNISMRRNEGSFNSATCKVEGVLTMPAVKLPKDAGGAR